MKGGKKIHRKGKKVKKNKTKQDETKFQKKRKTHLNTSGTKRLGPKM